MSDTQNLSTGNKEIDDFFSDNNKVKSNWIKWGKVGDYFKGTLLDVREVKSTFPGKENEMVKIYEFQGHLGSFHDMDESKAPIEPPVTVQSGDIWAVGGKAGIDSQMRNVKLGTIVGMRFTELVPSKTKGFAPSKVISVYVGGSDPNYMGKGADVADISM